MLSVPPLALLIRFLGCYIVLSVFVCLVATAAPSLNRRHR